MNLRTALLLGIGAGLLGWLTASWVVPIPWGALTVAYAAVRGGRKAGVVTAVAAGALLGASSGTGGPWVLALTVAVLPVDLLHRETLTHRTPAAPVLLAGVAILTALPVYWGATGALSLLTGTVTGPSTLDAATVALLRATVTGALLVVALRSLRTLGLATLRRVR